MPIKHTLLQEEELERVKNLVLIGKVPMNQAPPEMAKHPVMLIEKYCNKLIAARRAKVSYIFLHIFVHGLWKNINGDTQSAQ